MEGGRALRVRNDAVLRVVRDSYDMLVVDLFSLREGAPRRSAGSSTSSATTYTNFAVLGPMTLNSALFAMWTVAPSLRRARPSSARSRRRGRRRSGTNVSLGSSRRESPSPHRI